MCKYKRKKKLNLLIIYLLRKILISKMFFLWMTIIIFFMLHSILLCLFNIIYLSIINKFHFKNFVLRLFFPFNYHCYLEIGLNNAWLDVFTLWYNFAFALRSKNNFDTYNWTEIGFYYMTALFKKIYIFYFSSFYLCMIFNSIGCLLSIINGIIKCRKRTTSFVKVSLFFYDCLLWSSRCIVRYGI